MPPYTPPIASKQSKPDIGFDHMAAQRKLPDRRDGSLRDVHHDDVADCLHLAEGQDKSPLGIGSEEADFRLPGQLIDIVLSKRGLA